MNKVDEKNLGVGTETIVGTRVNTGIDMLQLLQLLSAKMDQNTQDLKETLNSKLDEKMDQTTQDLKETLNSKLDEFNDKLDKIINKDNEINEEVKEEINDNLVKNNEDFKVEINDVLIEDKEQLNYESLELNNKIDTTQTKVADEELICEDQQQKQAEDLNVFKINTVQCITDNLELKKLDYHLKQNKNHLTSVEILKGPINMLENVGQNLLYVQGISEEVIIKKFARPFDPNVTATVITRGIKTKSAFFNLVTEFHFQQKEHFLLTSHHSPGQLSQRHGIRQRNEINRFVKESNQPSVINEKPSEPGQFCCRNKNTPFERGKHLQDSSTMISEGQCDPLLNVCCK